MRSWCFTLGVAGWLLGCGRDQSLATTVAAEPPATATKTPTAPQAETEAGRKPATLRSGNPNAALNAEFGTPPTVVGWMQLSVGNKRYRIGQDASPHTSEPQARVHEPNSSKPSFYLSTEGNAPIRFSVGGKAWRLPGSVEDAGFTISDEKTGESWVSTDAKLEVTEFGAVGQPIAGWFQGTMSARLNRDPEPIRGRFWVVRGADHFSP